MKTKDVIEHFGDVKTLAARLNVTPQAIYQWGEIVPNGRDYQIQVITDGVLHVDTCETVAERAT